MVTRARVEAAAIPIIEARECRGLEYDNSGRDEEKRMELGYI